MKKKDFKLLLLNKESISKLVHQKVKGGSTYSYYPICTTGVSAAYCPSAACVTQDFYCGNSAMEQTNCDDV